MSTLVEAIAFRGKSEDFRQQILADLEKPDTDAAMYSWGEFLHASLLEVWALLSIDEKLVAYVIAEMLSRMPNRYDD